MSILVGEAQTAAITDDKPLYRFSSSGIVIV
jgi:hypothetical protein